MAFLGDGIGKLGFGLMRLPMAGGEVDIEHTKKMVDLFLEKGFTYFDTAFGYIDGKSEEAAKTALVDRYPRESFQLATKLPAWAGVKTAQEAEEMLYTSLRRTGAGYFDFYLLHNLGHGRTECFDRFGIWDFLAKKKEEGLIRHLGFSMHAKADYLDEILTKHPDMEFVQLQINYADWESEVVESRKCYETAHRHGKPVIIMEPVKGGALASLPESAANILKNADPGASAASWAIRYAASLDGVITVLSGMSNLEQMQDNISVMENFKPLNESEMEVVSRVRRVISEIPQVPCTDCKYCVKDCPENISIPGIFSVLNDYLVYGNIKRAKSSYAWETHGSGKASSCIECGQCESVCPQSIEIIKELAKVVEIIEK